MGVPLLLASAGGARRIVVQALAAGAVPVLVLGIWLTVSLGGAIALGVALVAFVLLAPDRLARAATAAACAAGSAVVVVVADTRPLIGEAARGPAAQAQAHEL